MSTRVADRRTGAGAAAEASPSQRAGSATDASAPPQRARASKEILLAAAKRVLRDTVSSMSSTRDWATAAEELASLTLAVQTAMADGELDLGETSGRDLRRRLLYELESAVRREGSKPLRVVRGEDPDLQRVLAALQEVRQAVDGDEETSVEDQLSGPNALELIAEVAHDLRSPLTSILTLAEALRREQSGPVNDLQRRQLGLVYSAALALSSTASDVIELAHGGDRLAQKEPFPFSIMDILQSTRDIVYPMAEEKGLELRLVADVPDRRLGYPLALSRVILNLTTNALKFTEEGFVEIAVRPTSAGPVHLEFSVRDSGRGMAPEKLKTLFRPFRRTPDDKGYSFSGTGLGLTICRRLCTAMDSELQLETEPGRGTRFYFVVALPQPDPFA
ncbi:MAG: HAMP domain-containing sensor histidine kinase [Gemmatimonadales bacterium]|jgi:signal transduction histidine kinase